MVELTLAFVWSSNSTKLGMGTSNCPDDGRRSVRTRQKLRKGKIVGTTSEIVYGVTSVPPSRGGPAEILARRHWEIENRVHHVRDMTYDEDRRRNHVGGSARALARNASIVRLRGPAAGSPALRPAPGRSRADHGALLTSDRWPRLSRRRLPPSLRPPPSRRSRAADASSRAVLGNDRAILEFALARMFSGLTAFSCHAVVAGHQSAPPLRRGEKGRTGMLRLDRGARHQPPGQPLVSQRRISELVLRPTLPVETARRAERHANRRRHAEQPPPLPVQRVHVDRLRTDRRRARRSCRQVASWRPAGWRRRGATGRRKSPPEADGARTALGSPDRPCPGKGRAPSRRGSGKVRGSGSGRERGADAAPASPCPTRASRAARRCDGGGARQTLVPGRVRRPPTDRSRFPNSRASAKPVRTSRLHIPRSRGLPGPGEAHRRGDCLRTTHALSPVYAFCPALPANRNGFRAPATSRRLGRARPRRGRALLRQARRTPRPCGMDGTRPMFAGIGKSRVIRASPGEEPPPESGGLSALCPKAGHFFLGGLLSRPPPDGLPLVLEGQPAPCFPPPPCFAMAASFPNRSRRERTLAMKHMPGTRCNPREPTAGPETIPGPTPSGRSPPSSRFRRPPPELGAACAP